MFGHATIATKQLEREFVYHMGMQQGSQSCNRQRNAAERTDIMFRNMPCSNLPTFGRSSLPALAVHQAVTLTVQ